MRRSYHTNLFQNCQPSWNSGLQSQTTVRVALLLNAGRLKDVYGSTSITVRQKSERRVAVHLKRPVMSWCIDQQAPRLDASAPNPLILPLNSSELTTSTRSPGEECGRVPGPTATNPPPSDDRPASTADADAAHPTGAGPADARAATSPTVDGGILSRHRGKYR